MIPTGLESELLRAARHEAGHWLVATRYGFGVSGIGRGFNTGQVEISLDRDTPDLKSLQTYCEQRVRVLLAGYLAEHVAKGHFDGVKATGNDWLDPRPGCCEGIPGAPWLISRSTRASLLLIPQLEHDSATRGTSCGDETRLKRIGAQTY